MRLRSLLLAVAMAAVAVVSAPPVQAASGCAGDGTTGDRIRVFNVYHGGSPEWSRTEIRNKAELATNKLSAAHPVAQDFRYVCNASSQVKVKNMQAPSSVDTTEEVRNWLRDTLGKNRTDRKYLTFLSGGNWGFSGWGFCRWDEPVQRDAGPNYAFVMHQVASWGEPFVSDTIVHELFHCIARAVDDGAPNSNGSGHSSDGRDIMHACGSCNSNYQIDPDNDDYYRLDDPDGSPNTWLELNSQFNIACSSFVTKQWNGTYC